MQKSIPCYIYRGGTSRGLILDETLLPPAGLERDAVLISLIGGPDPKQIDGLGGGVIVTSKVALIKLSEQPGIDIDYTFAQVVVGKNAVDYKANCGNISSAIGPYAIESGLIQAQKGTTKVVIRNTNTQKDIISVVPTPEGQVITNGDYVISGIQRTGAKIEMQFLDPAGAATGNLLPTGNPTDYVSVDGLGEVPVSVVDASNLFLFVRSEDVGLRGNELPEELDKNTELCEKLEEIRATFAERFGYVKDKRKAFELSPTVPKIAIIAPPSDYTTTNGDVISAKEMDIHIFMLTMKKMHKTFAMTGGMCAAAAAAVPGTVVNDIILRSQKVIPAQLALANPGGIMDVGVIFETNATGEVKICSTSGFRTARLLMKGEAFY